MTFRPQEARQDALGIQVLAVLPGGERVLRHTALDIGDVDKHANYIKARGQAWRYCSPQAAEAHRTSTACVQVLSLPCICTPARASGHGDMHAVARRNLLNNFPACR